MLAMRRMAVGVVLAIALGVAARADDVSREPQRVCDALKADGLPTSAWSAHDDAFQGVVVRNFRCLSEPLLVRGATEAGRYITALNYFAEGRLGTRVETIRLVLNVHAPATREAGRQRFGNLSDALFRNLGLASPPELAAALRDSREGNWQAAYGSVRLENWRSPIERVRLTINLSPPRRER